MKTPPFFEKIFRAIRARVQIGGLEISNLGLRFVHKEKPRTRFLSQPLGPGVIEGGLIVKREEFIEAAKALRAQIMRVRRGPKKQKVSVMVSLSFPTFYSQVFSLPFIQGENLEKAIRLNLQMASPTELKENYAGWQVVGEDKALSRIEILSVFIARAVVDEVTSALEEAGFLAAAVESSALSLGRLFRKEERNFDAQKPYALLHLKSGGMEFSILRHGQIYFEYFVSWKDVYAEEREIPFPIFRAALLRSFQQVLNFYGQHWHEPLGDVYLIAGDLTKTIEPVIQGSLALTPHQFALKINEIVEENWLIALGAALRSGAPLRQDEEINLLSPEGQRNFQDQHAITFLHFWRIALPATLLLLAVFFGVADFFLLTVRESFNERAVFSGTPDEEKTIQDLEKKVAKFNSAVLGVTSIRKEFQEISPPIEKVSGFAAQNDISIIRFSFRGFGQESLLQGEARSEDRIRNFKKAFEEDAQFEKINFPLDAIANNPRGVSFEARFTITAPKTP